MGRMAQAIAPIAQGVQQFTRYAEQPLDALTTSVSLFNSIPSFGHGLDLGSHLKTFVKDFPGNNRKSASDVLVVELLDKVTYLASMASGRSFFALTPVVTKAQEFVNNIDVLAQAAGSGASSIALPSLNYGVDISNKPDTEFTNASTVNAASSVNTESSGLPTMKPGEGGTSTNPNALSNSIYTNLSFPALENPGGLLKNIFLTPDKPIQLAAVDIGLNANASASGYTPGLFSANFSVNGGLTLQTGLVAQVAMNDIYDLVDDEKNMLSEFGDIILKGAALDLSRTKLDVDTNVTIGAGINLMSPWCFTINLGFWKKKICTKGLGASVNVGIDGSMDVYPELRLLNNSLASDQTISIADMISTFSSRRDQSLFKMTATGRTQPNRKLLNTSSDNSTESDTSGKEGIIRSVLTDYTAYIDFDVSGYLDQIDPQAADPAHLQIKVNLDNNIFVNLQTNDVSLVDDGSPYTVEIADTGWISAKESILTQLSSTPEFRMGQTYNFNDIFYLGQIVRNLRDKLSEFLKADFEELSTSPDPLRTIWSSIKPDMVLTPENYRKEVNEITNRILGMANAGGLDIALSEKQSLLQPQVPHQETHLMIQKLLQMVLQRQIPQGEDQIVSEYLSFTKNYTTNSGDNPQIVFGYKPIVVKSKSDVKATFKLLTNDIDFSDNIVVYVVDKDDNSIADLGTINELTNNTLGTSVSDSGTEYEEGDEDVEMTWDNEDVTMTHNHNIAGSLSLVDSENSDYSNYTVTLKVLNPEAEVGSGDIIVDPEKFTNGDYAFKLVNTDSENSTFTGIADIEITKHSDDSEADSDEISYDPKIEILDAYLRSGEQFKTFDQLLRSVWSKKHLRDKLLGNLMAHVPEEQESWKDFSAAIKEEYSTIIHESELIVNDLISENNVENADANNILERMSQSACISLLITITVS